MAEDKSDKKPDQLSSTTGPGNIDEEARITISNFIKLLLEWRNEPSARRPLGPSEKLEAKGDCYDNPRKH